MERIAYARLFSTVAGLFLVVIGLAGFATSAGFRNPELTAGLWFYPVNGWANSVHVIAGLAGLALARPLPRLFALLGGLLFLALGVWGILAPDGQLLFGGLPASRSVNGLNLVIGVLGLAALVASRWDRIRSGVATLADRLQRRLERRRQRRRRRRAARRRRSGPAAPGSRQRQPGATSGPRQPGATSSGVPGGGSRPAPKRR